MQTYIVLLRGINVSGKNILKMDALKTVLLEANFQNCTTYIQSGNIVFRTPILSPKTIQNTIKILLKENFNMDIPILVLKPERLVQLNIDNPFSSEAPKEIYFTLLSRLPEQEKLNLLTETSSKEDSFFIKNDHIYVHSPGGYGKTKFNNNFFEKKLDTTATTRNWKTIQKLIEIAQQVTNH